MRVFSFVLITLLSTAGLANACPAECNCFGWVGEWIADCARKDLTSVTFANFDAGTTEIHMQYNNIEVLDPMTFAKVPNLKHLYLQSNKISALPEGIFDNLPELQTLRLNHNRIADIGENKFAQLTSLILLYIHNNDIKTVGGDAFSGAEKIEQISVANNPNLVEININAFRKVENVTMVDISGTALTTLKFNWFTGMDMLDKVYSYGIDTLICDDELWRYITWMNTHPRVAFGRATMVCAEPEYLRGRSVLVVDPSRHLVGEDSCPAECFCIASGASTIVDCSSRELTSTPEGFPPQTTEIFLQNNNITQLGENDFLHLSKLEYLYLHDNDITSWGIGAFEGAASSLKQLTLHNNKLGTIPAGIFNGMNKLEVFGMDNNSVSLFRPNLFSDMVSVVQFSMQNNQIQTILEDTFSSFVSLKYMGLANNVIRSISDATFRNSANMYMLDISGNSLDVLPKIPASATKFEARNSKIKEITASALQDAANLDQLDLQGNTIYVIEKDAFAGAPQLEIIDLSYNTIQEITDETFSSAGALVVLDLSHNSRLTSISQNAFYASRKSLLRIFLHNSGLTTMSSNTLKLMENPGFYATLVENPWDCGCELQDLAIYISEGETTDNPTCSSPESEEGKELPEVNYCYDPVPKDENKALVISLSIVGAVLVFCAVLGIIVYKSKKSSAAKYASAPEQGARSEKKLSDSSNEVSYANNAFENGEGKSVPVSEL